MNDAKKRKKRKRKRKKKQFLYLSIEAAPLGSTDDIECAQLIELPVRRDGSVRIDFDMNVRSIDHIIIRPIRRPMDDVDGIVSDAKRLANN